MIPASGAPPAAVVVAAVVDELGELRPVHRLGVDLERLDRDLVGALLVLHAWALIAGSMALSDPALVNVDVLPQLPKLVVTDALKYGAGIGGALLVLLLGKAIAARRRATPEP